MPILNLAKEIAPYLPTHSDTNYSSGSAAGTVAAGTVAAGAVGGILGSLLGNRNES